MGLHATRNAEGRSKWEPFDAGANLHHDDAIQVADPARRQIHHLMISLPCVSNLGEWNDDGNSP